MAHTTHYLANASNAIINNPTITHVNGNAFFGSSERRGLKLLLKNISRGAFHDAVERGDHPKCHPDTRIAIREEIMEWVKFPGAMGKLILWMYGPAGAGKTAIGQSIAEECQKKGRLAASFFFGRTAVGRNDTARVIATIAYQISRFIPYIENHLFTAIERDPTIFSRSLAKQMEVLVIEPLKFVPVTFVLVPLPDPIFVILDGLDESGPSAQSQADLLEAIGMAVSELQHIPLKFLIASRSEHEIREAFAGSFLHSLVRPLSLDNHYNPDADIKLYFESTFRQLHAKCLRLGIHLSSPWPSASDVYRLVSKASGQFIFAATVMKFIDSVRHNPEERLDIILGMSAAGDETPFALLDVLYIHILSSLTDPAQVLEILTLLLLTRGPPLSVRMIEELLGIEVRRVLIDMHALVFVPPPTDEFSAVRIYHASLFDFFMDRSRSREYYIDKTQGHINLSRHWLKAMENRKISAEVPFKTCVNTFISHCRASPAGSEITNDLAKFPSKLRAILKEMYPHFAREIMETEWTDFFDCVKRQVKLPRRRIFASDKQWSGNKSDVFLRLHGEFLTFFIECISRYPRALQPFIPLILVLSIQIQDNTLLFHMLLSVACRSQTEIDKGRKRDSMLLNLYNAEPRNGIFRQLFEHRSLAGHYRVDKGNYLTLAKLIAGVIFPKPGKAGGSISLHRSGIWFGAILSRAAIDFALARFLLDHALQYRAITDDAKSVAWCSLRYVWRCGLPYLKHTHLEGCDTCVVCDEYGAASIVMGSHLPSSQPYLNNVVDNFIFSVRSGLRSFKSGRR